MILWTIQHYLAYEKLQNTGFLRADKNYLFCGDEFLHAYDWMGEKMLSHGLIPPQGVCYPIWAWYQWEGKRKRRDMREGGYAKRGEKIICVSFAQAASNGKTYELCCEENRR